MSGNPVEPFVVSKNFQFPAFKEVSIDISSDCNKLVNSFQNKLANKVYSKYALIFKCIFDKLNKIPFITWLVQMP